MENELFESCRSELKSVYKKPNQAIGLDPEAVSPTNASSAYQQQHLKKDSNSFIVFVGANPFGTQWVNTELCPLGAKKLKGH